MLEFKDFFHLPEIEPYLDQMVAEPRGLIIVAGLDARRMPGSHDRRFSLLPSGRASIFQMLLDRILATHEGLRCIYITDDRSSVRVARQFRRRIETLLVTPPYSYQGRLEDAIRYKPDLIVLDALLAETVGMALEAGRDGLAVLTQIDSLFWGAGVCSQLIDLGASYEQLDGVSWVLTVQRHAALCRQCRQAAAPSDRVLRMLRKRFPELVPDPDASAGYFRAGTCDRCHATGRFGDVAVFDVFHADREQEDFLAQPSQIPFQGYMHALARSGYLSIDDLLIYESKQAHQAFDLLVARESELADTKSAFEGKLREVEAANRVLEQRTRSLFALQEIAQALIRSDDLEEMAKRVCQRLRDICGADRAALYYLRTTEVAEILGLNGWEGSSLHRRLERDAVILPVKAGGLADFNGIPPGVGEASGKDAETKKLKAGLYVPLVAQQAVVGALIVHTTRESFTQGESALLAAFANQTALALQRAGLVEQLQAKIAQLVAAQGALAKKERMDRELELAREVQQSLLPSEFPEVPGFHMAVKAEPASLVGGDFYDIIRLDEDHFAVAVADVSDKGMAAALYMALTRSLLLAEAHRERSPARVVENVNRLLLELGQPNMFVTVFYGVIELSTRNFCYVRAGHDHPLLFHQGKSMEIGGQGMPLGIFEQGEFKILEEEVTLAEGDRLFLFTDGLPDVQDEGGHFFGSENLLGLFSSCSQKRYEEVCDCIFDRLKAFQGRAEQYDDMTLIVVEVDG